MPLDKAKLLIKLTEEEEALVKRLEGVRDRMLLDLTLGPEDRVERASTAATAALEAEGLVRGLRRVQEARTRSSDPSWGLCEDCEEEIPERRLLAVPWTTRCVPCQESQERREGRRVETSGRTVSTPSRPQRDIPADGFLAVWLAASSTRKAKH